MVKTVATTELHGFGTALAYGKGGWAEVTRVEVERHDRPGAGDVVTLRASGRNDAGRPSTIVIELPAQVARDLLEEVVK